MKELFNNDWDAQYYNRHHSQFHYSEVIDILSQLKLVGNERILDVGCGDGKLTAYLAQAVPQGFVVGIDISDNMINFAQDVYKTISNLSFEQANATALSFNMEFDLVVSSACLHWIEDQKTAIQNMVQSLKPNGQILLRAPCAEMNTYAQAKIETTQLTHWKQYFKNYTYPLYLLEREQLTRMLKDVGLQSISVEVKNVSFTFLNKQLFSAWIQSIPYGVNRIPLGLKKQFINDVMDTYFQKVPLKKDGSIELLMPTLLAFAEKVCK